jgi:hypothetical protein
MRNKIPLQTPNSAVDAAPRQRCTQIPLVPQSQKLVITEMFVDNSSGESQIIAQKILEIHNPILKYVLNMLHLYVCDAN